MQRLLFLVVSLLIPQEGFFYRRLWDLKDFADKTLD